MRSPYRSIPIDRKIHSGWIAIESRASISCASIGRAKPQKMSEVGERGKDTNGSGRKDGVPPCVAPNGGGERESPVWWKSATKT